MSVNFTNKFAVRILKFKMSCQVNSLVISISVIRLLSRRHTSSVMPHIFRCTNYSLGSVRVILIYSVSLFSLNSNSK